MGKSLALGTQSASTTITQSSRGKRRRRRRGVQEGSAAALLTAAALHSFIHSLAAWKAVLYAWPCQAVASSSFPFWISNKCPENG